MMTNNIAFQEIITHLNWQNKSTADSLIVMALHANNTFYPVIGSYQSTLSNGGIRIFNNDNLISMIINLYDSYYKRLEYNGVVLDEKYFYLTRKYMHQRRIRGLGEMTKIDTTDLLDDFYYFQKQQDFYIKRCEETLASIDQILNIMDINEK